MNRLVICAIYVALLSGCFTETKSSEYETGAHEELMGLKQRGWVPQELPEQARSITVRYDIDTNLSVGEFTAPGWNLRELEGCTTDFDGSVPSFEPMVRSINEHNPTTQCGTFFISQIGGDKFIWSN